MRRRHLLAAAGSALAGGLAGCLASTDSPPIRTAVDRPLSGGADRSPPSDACSEALRRPVSERLGDDSGGGECSRASLVLANERSAPVAVGLELNGAREGDAVQRLDPGERSILQRFVGRRALAGTVAVDGEEHTVEWPTRSCYRHGVAITPTGVETGWIEPAAGQGDVVHDCYVGETMPLGVVNRGGARTVRVTVHDQCTGTDVTERAGFFGADHEVLDQRVVTGRDYRIDVDGLRVEAASETFANECWPPRVVVDSDGSVSVDSIPIQ